MRRFDHFLCRWGLVEDGSPIRTRTADLLPVRQGRTPAMLKLASSEDARRGSALLQWWQAAGAARVLARHDDALLMERATGSQSLSTMARDGRDDEAARILCSVARELHRPRAEPLPQLVPLPVWFRRLPVTAAAQGGLFSRSADVASTLMEAPQSMIALHGDLHHGNVLDFADRGWCAIDPHGLLGERAFDFANIFTNPDLADSSHPVATDPHRFAARVEIVCEEAGLERVRLLQWVLAWAGLSASWFLEDDDPLIAIDLAIAGLAAAELDR